jgi:hypothetical protein
VAVRPESVPTDVSEDETTVEFNVVPVRVPAAAVTVIFAVPSNDVPLIVRAVCSAVAVEAFPLSAAVIVPAEKFPEPSLATIADTVFADVAVVAEFGILVSEAPEPLNTVAARVPVDGVKVSFVLDTFCGLFPDVAPTHVIYWAVAVVVSSVVPVFVALVAFVAVPTESDDCDVQVGVPEPADVRTCPDVPALVNA